MSCVPSRSGRSSPIYDANDPAYLAQRMLEQERYALLLRPQIAANLKKEQLQAAMRSLDEAMGIVPEGDVLLQSWRAIGNADDGTWPAGAAGACGGHLSGSAPGDQSSSSSNLWTDGGYENMSLWDATIWPAVLDFVDRTGHPGPRFWEDGHFPDGSGRSSRWWVSVGTKVRPIARWAGKAFAFRSGMGQGRLLAGLDAGHAADATALSLGGHDGSRSGPSVGQWRGGYRFRLRTAGRRECRWCLSPDRQRVGMDDQQFWSLGYDGAQVWRRRRR